MTKTTNSLLFLAIATVLIASPLALNDAFAAKGDDNGQPFQELQTQIDDLEQRIGDTEPDPRVDSFFDVFFDVFTVDSFFDVFFEIDTQVDQNTEDIETIETEIVALDLRGDTFEGQLAQEISDRQAGDATLQAKTTDNMMDIGEIQIQLEDLQLVSHPPLLAGPGLNENSGTFEVDFPLVQQRILGTVGICPVESSIRVINPDGTVICEEDTDTKYSAGYGLRDNFGEFTVDTNLIQNRISSTCPAGQSIRVINGDGTVVCEVDDSAATANKMIFSFSSGTDFYEGNNRVLGHGEISGFTTDIVAYDGIMKNLYVHAPLPMDGDSITITLDKGPLGVNSVVPTLLSCTILNGETSCTNLNDEVPMSAGEHFRLLVTGNGVTRPIVAAMEYSSP